MFIKPYKNNLRKGQRFVYFCTPNQVKKYKINSNLKEERDLERVCRLGMSSRSIIIMLLWSSCLDGILSRSVSFYETLSIFSKRKLCGFTFMNICWIADFVKNILFYN